MFFCKKITALLKDLISTAEEARIKLIQFDRPARELLIWSVLVGKLRMSELFWTMEKV